MAARGELEPRVLGLNRPTRSVPARSVQSTTLPDLPQAFDVWGDARGLEHLLHAYFNVAARSVWGLAVIRWRAGRPTFELAGVHVPLLSMSGPSVELEADRRAISVTVEGGVLVAAATSTRLTLALEREPPLVRASVELADYHPRGGHWLFVRLLYTLTQGQLHVWVGHRFLSHVRRTWSAASDEAGWAVGQRS